MSDSDRSLYNLRYNQITQGMEGFGGGSPAWSPLTLLADGGMNQLTGDVTAGPGTGSQVATVPTTVVTGKLLTGYVSGAGTVAATDSILQAIQKLNGNIGGITPSAISTEILFLSGTVPTGDTNLVWNSTTHRMGIGGAPVSYPLEITTGNANGAYVLTVSTSTSAAAGFLATNNSSHSVQLLAGDSARGDAFQGIGAVYAASMALLLGSSSGNVSIAAGGTTAQLTVTTEGLLNLTPLTTTARDATTPVEGSVIYNSTLHKLQVWTGAAWETITSA